MTNILLNQQKKIQNRHTSISDVLRAKPQNRRRFKHLPLINDLSYNGILKGFNHFSLVKIHTKPSIFSKTSMILGSLSLLCERSRTLMV